MSKSRPKVHFYHCTTDYALPCIMRRGLLTALAIGNIRGIWLARDDSLLWAVAHTCARHRIELESVRIIELVETENTFVHHMPGAWYSHFDIPTGRFCRILTTADLDYTCPADPVRNTPGLRVNGRVHRL